MHADISRFYHSIYTHSIPWAIHGKRLAKTNRDESLYGNVLDKLVRNCQDGQTLGIPVGPDTSLLFAEMILNRVDEALAKHRIRGMRYVDDYELVFESESEAFRGVAILQKALLQYELHLNPLKTKIKPLPESLDERWVQELKFLSLKRKSTHFKELVIRYFNKAFELSKLHPGENVLKLAAGRILALTPFISETNLIEDLLLQAARLEPGILPSILTHIVRTSVDGIGIKAKREKLFLNAIIHHAPLGHSSEVAWALWACLLLKIKLPNTAVKAIAEMNDSICSIFLLHAHQLSLVKDGGTIKALCEGLSKEDLYLNHWLLAYEAEFQGWTGTNTYARNDTNFARLMAKKVSFYDTSMSTMEYWKTGDTDEIDFAYANYMDKWEEEGEEDDKDEFEDIF